MTSFDITVIVDGGHPQLCLDEFLEALRKGDYDFEPVVPGFLSKHISVIARKRQKYDLATGGHWP